MESRPSEGDALNTLLGQSNHIGHKLDATAAEDTFS